MISDNVKSRMKMNRKLQTEYLLNNIIDNEFQSMLFPLGFVPSFFLMSQFSVINNFITPETRLSSCIKSFIGSIIMVLSHFFRFFYYTEAFKRSTSDVVIFLFYFDLIFFSIISIITHIVSSYQRTNVVELIITLQHVLNSIKIDKIKFFSKHKNHNWYSILMVFSVYVFHCLFASQHFRFLDLLVNFTLAVPMLIYDMHVVTVTRTVVMIKNELLAWNHIMEEYKNIYITPQEDIINVTVSESEMFDVYVNVIKAFSLCNKVYQFSYQHLMMGILSVVWNMKGFLLMVVLSIACENFYRSTEIAESSCAQLLRYSKSADMRKTCKNVLRLNRASLCKMSAFGVFELDATFPLRLLSGLVTYSVVLLQFAFLST
ncbi:uncharacterized protein LOC133530422 [Cydia pomonella]|uniref:uncharacterized protein LOC133530422 n=1 Tax=Cydia pomonella TaxID=82600 RepID=UPI002ADE1193|nr:uncharacterized protein LOC133530422 [Cydia pomonella]